MAKSDEPLADRMAVKDTYVYIYIYIHIYMYVFM